MLNDRIEMIARFIASMQVMDDYFDWHGDIQAFHRIEDLKDYCKGYVAGDPSYTFDQCLQQLYWVHEIQRFYYQLDVKDIEAVLDEIEQAKSCTSSTKEAISSARDRLKRIACRNINAKLIDDMVFKILLEDPEELSCVSVVNGEPKIIDPMEPCDEAERDDECLEDFTED